MQANKAFYVIGVIIAAVVSLMVWFLFSGSSSPAQPATQADALETALKDLSPEELRAMGIEGDTPKDTVRTLIGNAKANSKKIDDVIRQNEQLIKENERLKNQQANVDYQIQQAVQSESNALLGQFNELRSQLLNQAQAVNNTQFSANANSQEQPLPINGAQGGNNPSAAESSAVTINGMNWVGPSDVLFDSNGKSSGGNAATNNTTVVKQGLPFVDQADETVVQGQTNQSSSSRSSTKGVTPFYTIAPNSTLTNSVAMTALVGRVPIDNNVTEPYPFKLLIGRDNLIANGIELPDVEGAIVSGTATGDWTLSCVRGKVTSFTFVFSDGRIVNSSSGSSSGSSDSLGWISDPHGVPCIPGSRKTNAPEYLGTNFLLMGASAAAQGMSQSQTTSVVDNGAIIGAVTGNNGQYILGQALGGGLRETAEWFRQRYGQTFDAVYVPPGHELAVHIEKEIQIDYNRNARKVKYGRNTSQSGLD